MAKRGLKRMAGVSGDEEGPATTRKRITNYTSSKYSVAKFVAALLEILGVAPVKSETLILSTGCSGAGTPTYAARAVLGKKNVTEIWAAECDQSAAHFLVVNCKPAHVFTSMEGVKPLAFCPCYMHAGRMCQVPQTRPDVYVCGFSCKPHSTRHPQRWKRDNIKPPGEDRQMDSFYECRRHILDFDPKISILENVVGLTARRVGNCLGSAMDFILSDPQHGLRTLPGRTVDFLMVDGVDGLLPTTRPRVYFVIVAADMPFSAEEVVALAKELKLNLANMPVHSIDSFLPLPGCHQWIDGPWTEHADIEQSAAADRLKLTAAYGNFLHESFVNALAAKRLPTSAALKPLAQRMSSVVDPGQRVSPGIRARIDVLEAVADHAARDVDNSIRIADVSTSCNLAQVRVDGLMATIATQSRMFDYERKACFAPDELFALHGFDTKRLKFHSLSWAQATNLIGNSMCVTSVLLLLVPALAKLGFLAEVPTQ